MCIVVVLALITERLHAIRHWNVWHRKFEISRQGCLARIVLSRTRYQLEDLEAVVSPMKLYPAKGIDLPSSGILSSLQESSTISKRLELLIIDT